MDLNLGTSQSGRKRKKKDSSEFEEGVRKFRSRRFLTFIGFVFLAFCFWLIRSLQMTYHIQIEVPIVYDELPPNVRYPKNAPDKAVFTIQDVGLQLIQYDFQHFEPIRVRLHGKDSKQLLLSRKGLVEEFQKQLNPSTTVISSYPQEIALPLYELHSKSVPVKMRFKPITPQGYILSRVTFTPATVNIFGSKDALKRVDAAYIDSISLAKHNESFSTDIQLAGLSRYGIDFAKNKMTVKARFEIEALTEMHFELPIQAINVPEGYHLRLLPNTASVDVTIPKSKYNILTSDQIELQAGYPQSPDGVIDPDITLLPVVISKKPDWVIGARIEPQNVEFILEKL